MANGFGGIRGAGLPRFAEAFAAAGLSALVFDYRFAGASDGEPRGLIDVSKQREDYRAAVSFARSLEAVDGARIILWGASFSSGHALTLAAQDKDVTAAILTNPFVDGPAAIRKTVRSAGVRVASALAVDWARDELRRIRGREPHRVDLVGPPGARAIFTTPDAMPGYESILPADRSGWEPAVPARVLLRIAIDRPAANAAAVTCPLLVCVCDQDRITPIRPAVQVADTARHGELLRYPIGHFDVFLPPWSDRVAADQAEFARRSLT